MTLDYELAKSLKEAMFPYKSRQLYEFSLPNGDKISLLVPTLSELIESCGGKNISIVLDLKGRATVTSFLHAVATEGEDLTEALAMLYLALHAKDKGSTSRLEGR